MRRTSLVALLVFVAGLGIGYAVRGAVGPLQQRYRYQGDLAAIERLNQEDIDATLVQDPKRLIELWAEDAVVFNPGSSPAVGKQAIKAWYDKGPRLTVLSYTSKYTDLHVEGGVASEWFEKNAQFKLSSGSPPISWHSSGVLVLKRQADASWKTAMIWSE